MPAAKPTYVPIVTKYDPRGIDQAQGAFRGLKSSLSKIASAVAVAFAVRAVVNFGKESIIAAEAVQEANNRIGSIAKSMDLFGGATEDVTQRLIKFAESKELQFGVDAELIKAGQAQLLTFKSIAESAGVAGGAFDRATVAAADLAAAGFGSIDSASIMLGKALNDPLKGLTALGRAGVQFTSDQKALIKSFVDVGDVASAQNLILAEVERQVGGTAQATAKASEKIKLAFGNIKEEAGAVFLPLIDNAFPVIEGFTKQLGAMVKSIFVSLTPALTGIAMAIPGILSALMPIIPVIGELVVSFLKFVQIVLEPLAKVIAALAPIVLVLVDAFLQLLSNIIEPLVPVVENLIDAFMPLVNRIIYPLVGALSLAVPLFMDLLIDAFTPLVPVIEDLVREFIPMIQQILPALFQLAVALIPPLLRLIEEVFIPLVPILADLFLAFLPILTDILPQLIRWMAIALPIWIDFLTMVLQPMIPAIQVLAGWIGFLANAVLGALSGVMNNLVLPAMKLFKSTIGEEIPKVIQFTSGVIGMFQGQFKAFSEAMKTAWGNVGSFFKGTLNNMVGALSGFINTAINGLNSLLRIIDKVGNTLRTLTGGAIGWDINFTIPGIKLPELAEGGLVMPQPGGVLAMLAEAGQPEVVIPLDRLGEFQGGGNNIQITINAGVGTDPVSVGRAVVNAIKRYETTSGRVFLAG